ncbi:hypothetical protein OAB59_01435 [Pelagibacteraceae bacterium]|nr:hypothetical protein [Pelagibacteraceae bacterium]
MKKIFNKINFLSLLIVVSFFIGFFFNENSAGAGGYKGDITWLLGNIDIFKNNSLYDSIFHPDLFGNRTPIIYVINKLFNPYFYDYEKYRIVVFLISLSGSFFFYLCLKIKNKNTNTNLLILISTIILLSPFYRTSGFWGLNENYGLVTAIISLTTLNYFLEKIKINSENNFFYYLTIFFSSLCVYFDQKLVIIPLICFFSIWFSNIGIKYRILSVIIYFLLSVPFLILIFKWGGLVPPLTQLQNPKTITSLSRLGNLYFYNLGYAFTLMAFYLFPLIFFKKVNVINLIKQQNYSILLVPLIYIFFIFLILDFKIWTVDEYWVGLGYIHKASLILFDSIKYQEIFTYFSFLASWLVVALYLDRKSKDYLVIIFFLILSLIIWPLMQEYFDPIILILFFLMPKINLEIKSSNSIFLVFYLTLFLIIANIYYFYKI